MPDNNLQINIIADATKARAELFKLQGDLKEFGRQARQAVAAHDQAATQRAAEGYERTRASISRVTEGLKSVSGAAKETSSWVGELTKKFGELAHASGMGIPGMRALRLGMIALAGVEVTRAIKAAIDGLNDLNNAANRIGIRPENLRQMRQAVEQIGQTGETADRIASSAIKNINEARLAQKQLGTAFGEGGVIFRGGRGEQPRSIMDLSTVLRGGQVGGGDLEAEIRKAGGVAPYVLGRPVRGGTQDLQEIAKRILAIRDEDYRQAIAQKMYGTTFEEAFGTAQAPGVERQRALGILPEVKKQTEQQQRDLVAHNKDVASMTRLWEEGTEGIAELAVATEQALKRLSAWQEMLTTQSGGKLAVPSQSEAAPLGGASGLPYASGGAVHGPGTGTSDSILARLSDGEYVINAASVRRLGTSFLDAMNGFALGGLVAPPPILPAFADGGTVGTAAQANNVHLHFAGEIFGPLQAEDALVTRLVHASARAQMRSAGKKPSWLGG